MPEAQSQIRSRTGQVTIGKLALFRIEKVAVPLPPIEAQIRFTQVANNIGQQKNGLQRSAEQLDALFASLQHRAFAGTL
jgi:type I restriction enzyme S subunit